MCLNLWQIRNETLAANNEKMSYINERNDLLKQAQGIQEAERANTINASSETYLPVATQP